MWVDNHGLLKLTVREQRILAKGGEDARKLRKAGRALLANSKTIRRHERTHGVKYFAADSARPDQTAVH